MKNIESFKSLEENFSSLWLQYPPFKESKKTRCSAFDITLSSGKHDLQCHISTSIKNRNLLCA